MSIIIPVYNAEKTLDIALDSVCSQTFQDLEILVIENGSTDSSWDMLKSWETKDPRIKIFRTPAKGIVAALNFGLLHAQNNFIARMDADDICDIRRIEWQYNEMVKDDSLSVLGGQVRKFGDSQETFSNYPCCVKELSTSLIFSNPIAHPTVMFNKVNIPNCHMTYQEGYPAAEDYELWTRLVDTCRIRNLDKVILHYRTHGNQTTLTGQSNRISSSTKIQKEYLVRLGLNIETHEVELHGKITSYQSFDSFSEFLQAGNWIKKIYNQLKDHPKLDKAHLFDTLQRLWLEMCNRHVHFGLKVLVPFLMNPLSGKKRNLFKKSGRIHMRSLMSNLITA